jgi:peptidoglycan/LPS O-acetylase OafA/YrhL
MPASAAPPAASIHVAALDGLRGLAAMAVVVAHTFNAVAMPDAVRAGILATPLALGLNGQAAVQLFFVLSGFVLAGSLERSGERAPWLRFYTRRFFRIHPPYVVAALVAFATSPLWTAPPEAALANAARHWIGVRVGAAELLPYLAFPGNAGGLLPVGWTLGVEMVFSALLPLLLLAARPARGLPLLAAGCVLLLATPRGVHWYTLDFALGIAVYRERAAIASAVERIPAGARWAILLAAAWLFAAPPVAGAAGAVGGLVAERFHPQGLFWMALASGLFVVGAIAEPRFAGALATRPCRFLGRISYSLYLLHHTVIKLVAGPVLSLDGAVRVPLLFAVVIGLTIAVSIPCQRFVEQPSMDLGRRLGRRRHANGRPSRA